MLNRSYTLYLNVYLNLNCSIIRYNIKSNVGIQRNDVVLQINRNFECDLSKNKNNNI